MEKMMKKSLEERKALSKRLLEQNPLRIPLVLDKKGNSELKKPPKSKYLVPKHFKVLHLLKLIKKDIEMKQDQTLYFFIKDRIIKNEDKMEEIYAKYKDADGFLYAKYTEISSLG